VISKTNFINLDKRSKFSTWWQSVDKVLLAAILLLAAFSLITVTTASPAVASKIGLEYFYFIKKQMIYLVLGLFLMFFLSFYSINTVRRICVIGFVVCLVLLVLTLFFGYAAKGARRWLHIGGFSLQASEFAKLFFPIVTAWLFSIQNKQPSFPAFRVSLLLFGILVSLLVLQPDFGMIVIITAVWCGQLFIAGLSLTLMLIFACFALSGVFMAYTFLPHVKARIDSFLDPKSFENYQVSKSLMAFKNGGMYGVGPGEGVIKQHIPDAHTDFIFAVIGEEMGVVACSALVALFACIVIRGLYKVAKNTDFFKMLAMSGLLMQVGMQTIFNMGVTLHLFPTKGMTLPFISYGGSSVLSTSIVFGIILVLTKSRVDALDDKSGILNIKKGPL
jgi:cell division protein FtsW